MTAREAGETEVLPWPKAVLESLVIDTSNDHNTHDTARRVAKMYLTEVFRGRYVSEPPTTELPVIVTWSMGPQPSMLTKRSLSGPWTVLARIIT